MSDIDSPKKVPCICCSYPGIGFDQKTFTGVVEVTFNLNSSPEGTKYWLANGKKHRTDGPAVEYRDGSGEYWWEGIKLTKTDWEKKVTELVRNNNDDKLESYFSTYKNPTNKIKTNYYSNVSKEHPTFTGWATFQWQNHERYQGFYENGKFHNLMGPALVGTKGNLNISEFWIENTRYYYHHEYFSEVVKRVPNVKLLEDLKNKSGIVYCEETDSVYMLENGEPRKNLKGFPNVLRPDKYNANEVLEDLKKEYGRSLKIKEYLTTFDSQPRTKEINESNKANSYEEVKQNFPNLNGWITLPWITAYTAHFKNGVVGNLMGPAAIHRNGREEFWVNGKEIYSPNMIRYFDLVKNQVPHFDTVKDLKDNKYNGVAFCKETDTIYLLKEGKPTKNIDKIKYNSMKSNGKTADLDENFEVRNENEPKVASKFTQEVWKEYRKGYKTSTKIVSSLSKARDEKFTGWAKLSWCEYYAFFVNGVYHNEAGPATVDIGNSQSSEYWLDGVSYSKTAYFSELEKRTKVYNNVVDIPNEYIVIRADNQLGKFFLCKGKYKVDNVEGMPNSFSATTQEWKDQDGLKHRLDGPAVYNSSNGSKEYWIDGKQYSFDDWKLEKKKHILSEQKWEKTLVSVSETKQHQSCCLACAKRDSRNGWVNYNTGRTFWHLSNGKLHNLAGPAVIHRDGTEEYWIDGISYTRENYLTKLKTLVPWIYEGINSSKTQDRCLTGTVYEPINDTFYVLKDGKLFVPPETDTNPQPNTFFGENRTIRYEHRNAQGWPSNKHGPAKVYWNGTKEYWIDGKRFLTEDEWKKAVGKKDSILEAWLQKPNSNKTPSYYNLTSSQRDNFTGWVTASGNYYFLVNGKGHCDFGGAVLDSSLNIKEYRINGRTVSYKEWYKAAKNSLPKYDSTVHTQKKTGVFIRYGTDIEVFVDGQRQSINEQPSFFNSETRIWENSQGNRHRENDLPAVEGNDGEKTWYKNGLYHRDNDLPAITNQNGQWNEWWVNGQRHRVGGKPAIEDKKTETYHWFVNGQRHREDGPAVLNKKTGASQFFLNGCNLTNAEYEKKNPQTFVDTDDMSSVSYGKVEKKNKETGQVIMTSKLLNGKLHCVTGPAVTHENGEVEYWINGTQYSHKDFLLQTKQNYPLNAWSSRDLYGYTGWAYYNGCTRYYKDGKLDTPPLENKEIPTYESWGDKYWYENGKLLKKITNSGVVYWYNARGQYHSPDNDTPSYEHHGTNTKAWHKNGAYHRENDLPALVDSSGSYWYKKSMIHRTTGPAFISENGKVKEYYVNGLKITEDEFYEKYATITKNGIPNFRNESIPKTFTGTCLRKGDTYTVEKGILHSEIVPAFVSSDGKTQKWYKNGKPHREDGPAVTLSNGEVQYWVEGKLHRLDGPAIIRADGTKEYWINGKLHSNKGAAKSFASGIREYIVEGKRLSKREWQKLTNPIANDAKDAAYRIARNQLIKVIREFLADEISKKTSGKTKKEEARNAALEFLSSEVGMSVVFGAIGILLPKLGDKLPGSVQPHLERLNKEFRVSAMATVGNEAVSLLTSSIVLGKTKEILSRLDREAEQKITIESVELVANKPLSLPNIAPTEEKVVVGTTHSSTVS